MFGVSMNRLRASDLLSLGPGIYVHKSVELTREMVILARARRYAGGVVVGPSAAVLHKMPLPYWLDDPDPLAPTCMAFLHPHEVPTNQVIEGGYSFVTRDEAVPIGDPTADPRSGRLATRERTWLSLLNSMTLEYAVAIADHLLRVPRPRYEEGRHSPYSSVEKLQHTIDTHGGTPGIILARRALELARVGADSVQESRCRLAFYAAGLPEPVLNLPLRDAQGVSLGTPDFYWKNARVAAEYDGSHHREIERFTWDRDKDAAFERLGVRVIRLFKTDVAPPLRRGSDDMVLRNLAHSNAVRLVGAALRNTAPRN